LTPNRHAGHSERAYSDDMSVLGPLILVLLAIVVLLLVGSIVTVQQGTIGVLTMFGKYRRVLQPGLNFRLPLIEKMHARISTQNRALELQFQAITNDQANVYFTAMLLYSVLNADEQTIKNVAFKFMDQQSFMQALVRSVEGTVRSYVATQKQAEILALRSEIIAHVKDELDNQLEAWGYHLLDIQVNDITFDQVITQSMAQVVASNNLMIAATNEGAALLIRKTKEAEAEGASIRISAQAEKEAAQLRGQGVALFRTEVAGGMAAAAETMETAHLDPSFILFSMWTEALRHFASEGKGNAIFLDGSTDGMQHTLRQMMALDQTRSMPPPPPGQ
jgi:regulator of protease activity HflC (stomatin/prohibitin superfamily)